ncbi:MAG: hypothetical protein ACLTXT_04355 [Ruminococcus callidus]
MADTGSGKYISLDHQTPLGVNGTGISLSEYYSKYADSEGSNINGGTKGNTPGGTKPVQTGTTELNNQKRNRIP